MKVVTAEQMKNIDRACVERGTPVSTLMDRAGRAVAEATRDYLGSLEGRKIISLAGGGNNGGDAIVAARYLHDWGASVNICLCSQREVDEAILRMLWERGVGSIDAAARGAEPFISRLPDYDCIIDGLLGTGRLRPIEGLFREVLEAVKAEREKRGVSIIAVDLPSGMDADTGSCDPACCPADVTVTLAMPKPGLFGVPGADYTGKLVVADIGIPETLAAASKVELMDGDFARRLLPSRPRTANKGTFGKLLVVAGSVNYTGAASLACRGALRSGTGLVTLATAASLHPVIAAGVAEVTHLPLPESPVGYIGSEAAYTVCANARPYDALLVGCGLGRNPATAEFIRSLLHRCPDLPLVLDADALNILSEEPDWSNHFNRDTVITPHPGEMSRLAGITIPQVQADRLGCARDYAEKWNKTIVLKGAYSAVAAPDGRCRISPFINPGLASGGTGDVLAGIIGGLAAQGMALFDAASLGVFLHGTAGERVRARLGETGMIASDLLPELPLAIQDLKSETPGTGMTGNVTCC